jgi:hypothetical protein
MESQRRSFCSHHYTPADLDDLFNVTATFKHDSHLLADYKDFAGWPRITHSLAYVDAFKQFVAANSGGSIEASIARKITSRPATRSRHSPFIFWFVSNCHTPSRREEYVHELLQHVGIDIYGECSKHYPAPYAKRDPCSTQPPPSDVDKCTHALYNSYKFYLAFENSQCNEYISEKYWKIYSPERLFGVHVVPVVRGARDSHYQRISVTQSYINADAFETPRHLADYLKYLEG